MTLGQVFADAEVARAYRVRPPYPKETFAILGSLLVEPRTVLDAGAGSGALAREMLAFAKSVDAIDPSAAMITAGRALPHGDDPRLHWILGTAEEAPLGRQYGLITAGASIHWMDAERVMPRFAAALAPGAKLAIVDQDFGPHPLPSMIDIVTRYSEEAHHRELPEIIHDLESSGRFVREGERRTTAVTLRRTLDEYLEYLHSTSTLARIRLGDRSDAFDAEVRELFARQGMDAIEREYWAVVVWGRPQ